MTQKIWIYDNNEEVSKNWTEKLEKLNLTEFSLEPIMMEHDQFLKNIRELLKRKMDIRDGKKIELNSLEIDEAAIFIVDYDLFSHEKNSIMTGEDVAYLVRCFSNCGLIIGVNQYIKKYGTNYFDLSLKGNLDSFCDLNIGEDHLDISGLWKNEFKKFRPWYWPQLPKYYETFQKRMEDVIKNPKRKICKIFQMEDKIIYYPNSIKEFLGNEPEKTSFEDFVFQSGNGLRGKDKSVPEELLARIAAARISKWLERRILPGQNILIDAPHLVSRYPSLLLGNRESIDTWNKTVSFENYEKLGLDNDKIEKYRFINNHWLSRPCWFWEDLSNDPRIKEVSVPWEREEIKFNFCEDCSRFLKKKDCIEFVIDSESPYLKRYVKREPFKGVNYQPKVRLLIT